MNTTKLTMVTIDNGSKLVTVFVQGTQIDVQGTTVVNVPKGAERIVG